MASSHTKRVQEKSAQAILKVNQAIIFRGSDSFDKPYCVYVCVIQQKSFLILETDDFHNIHVLKMPSETVLTNAVHMVTMLLDIQPTVSAVPLPPVPQLFHRHVLVSKKDQEPQICRGGISSDAVIKQIRYFWSTYCLFFRFAFGVKPFLISFVKGIIAFRVKIFYTSCSTSVNERFGEM